MERKSSYPGWEREFWNRIKESIGNLRILSRAVAELASKVRAAANSHLRGACNRHRKEMTGSERVRAKDCVSFREVGVLASIERKKNLTQRKRSGSAPDEGGKSNLSESRREHVLRGGA